MVNLSPQAFLIMLFIAFALGMLAGALLAYSRADQKKDERFTRGWREFSSRLPERPLKEQILFDESKDLSGDWKPPKPPSNKDIDFSKYLRDLEKEPRDKKRLE